MVIYHVHPDSRATDRVMAALSRHAPAGTFFTDNIEEADLVIFHTVGRRDKTQRQITEALNRGQRYAMIQYCLRSTQKPLASDWVHLWRNAEAVWSYYDLAQLCADDGVAAGFNFYHSPLGVDSTVFYPREIERAFAIVVGGGLYRCESIRECIYAARDTGLPVGRLGGPISREGLVNFEDITDSQLAILYSSACYVSGLRRTEGFEMMAAEGLLCGARPVLFDRPHYRTWHDQWGIFIKEGPRAQVIEALRMIFAGECQPVTEAELALAREVFDWRRIVSGFWAALGGIL